MVPATSGSRRKGVHDDDAAGCNGRMEGHHSGQGQPGTASDEGESAQAPTPGDSASGVVGSERAADGRELVALEVSAALRALACDDSRSFEEAAARVAERPGIVGWRRATERALLGHLQSAVSGAWRRGWQPDDLVRVARRRLSGPHVRLIRDAIAAELSGYAAATIDPRWTAQLAELEARVWWRPDETYLGAWAEEQNTEWAAVVHCALEAFDLLSGLPEFEKLGPIPGTARPTRSAANRPRPAVDERVLNRVRALLAKAESTTFPAEAEAFTAGAQALMARHSIDLALLAATEQSASDAPGGRRIGIDNPYEGPKATLLGAVASANRCRTVWSQQFGFGTAVGFPTDVDGMEMLFTSLLVQATTAMTEAGSRTDPDGRSRTRGFRQSVPDRLCPTDRRAALGSHRHADRRGRHEAWRRQPAARARRARPGGRGRGRGHVPATN